MAGYVAIAAWLRGSSLNGGLSALSHVPADNLLVILVGIAVLAAAGGWLLAGRRPAAFVPRSDVPGLTG